jgi:hypothetical protein
MSKTIVYHISRIKNRASIFEHGLQLKSKKEGRIKYHKRIFVSTELFDLAFDYVDFENVDCWQFQIEKAHLKKDTFSSSENHYYIEVCVKPDSLELIATY